MGPAVLMVEDNRADVAMLTVAFRDVSPDYRVRVAQDGKDAIALLNGDYRNSLPALGLIILDLNLPRVSGFEAFRLVRGWSVRSVTARVSRARWALDWKATQVQTSRDQAHINYGAHCFTMRAVTISF